MIAKLKFKELDERE